MQWSDLSFTPSSKTLRQFAGLWAVFFGALAAWQGFREGKIHCALGLTGLAATVGLLGLLKPQAVRLIYLGSAILAFPIGRTVSCLVLAALYYAVFTPVGLLFRLIGRDVLDRRRRLHQPSYWSRKSMPSDVRSYLHQF